MSTLYTSASEDYLKHNPTWHQEDSQWKASQIIKILKKNNLKPETALEVGCGAGAILYHLSKEYPETKFVGSDISDAALEMAKPYETDNICFTKNVTENEHFDLLMMIDVFEHVDDYIGFLKEHRPLATHHIFHIPLDMTVYKVLRPKVLMHNRLNIGHLHYFTKEAALETLRYAGYTVVDYHYTLWGLETPQPTLLKKIGRLPLRLLCKFSKDLAAKTLGGMSLIVLTK
jgi:SAM-dependent methyltransferase